AAADKFPLGLDRHRAETQMLGHLFNQWEIHHETELATELAVTGFLWIIEDFQVGRACVKTAESDRIRGQHTLGLLDRCASTQIHRDQDLLLDLLEKFRDGFPVGDLFHSVLRYSRSQMISSRKGGTLFSASRSFASKARIKPG